MGHRRLMLAPIDDQIKFSASSFGRRFILSSLAFLLRFLMIIGVFVPAARESVRFDQAGDERLIGFVFEPFVLTKREFKAPATVPRPSENFLIDSLDDLSGILLSSSFAEKSGPCAESLRRQHEISPRRKTLLLQFEIGTFVFVDESLVVFPFLMESLDHIVARLGMLRTIELVGVALSGFLSFLLRPLRLLLSIEREVERLVRG